MYAGAPEVEKNASGTTVKTYWPGGIGLEIDRPGVTVSELYWHHLDRLGSVIGLTDQQGVLKEKLGYDAWGKRRSIDGSATPNNLDGQVNNRGFTGHEMLDQLDLVHMNGRVYDPLVARFVSGDPLIQDPVDGQNYNRYSYVLNNPTNNTDPTGFECQTMTGSRICGNITSAACSGNCNSGLLEVDPGANKDVRREKKQDGKTNAKDGGNTTAQQQGPQSANTSEMIVANVGGSAPKPEMHGGDKKNGVWERRGRIEISTSIDEQGQVREEMTISLSVHDVNTGRGQEFADTINSQFRVKTSDGSLSIVPKLQLGGVVADIELYKARNDINGAGCGATAPACAGISARAIFINETIFGRLNSYNRKFTYTHEFGHNLGLDHRSNSRSTRGIMNYETKKITDQDIQDIFKLYRK